MCQWMLIEALGVLTSEKAYHDTVGDGDALYHDYPAGLSGCNKGMVVGAISHAGIER